MADVIELFFLEHDFYTDSKTTMSQLYTIKERTRYDWGFVENALRCGTEVKIRPATDDETLWAFKKLAKTKADFAKADFAKELSRASCESCKTE